MPYRVNAGKVIAATVGVVALVASLVAAPADASHARARAGAARTAAASTAHAYPSPGTVAASPTSGITFRDVVPGSAGAVQVTGSVSGAHALIARPHRDGRGVTFQPRAAFAPGEQVTVRGVRVDGGTGDDFRFGVARPGRNPAPATLLEGDSVGSSTTRSARSGSAPSTTGSTRAAVGPPYKTRPDLNPPPITVSTPGTGTAPGLLLTNPGTAKGSGVALVDDRGQPVWFHGTPNPVVAGDLEKARYKGKDVLVWFEGTAPYGPGSYRGTWTMVDSAYRTVATIRAANGMQADIHDIEITPNGHAYLVIYHPVIRDLTAIGGSATANVLELVIQEVDIASGNLLFEWHSLDPGNFPVTDSVFPITSDPVDYIHGNSVMTDTDGNLLLSGRNASVVWKIRRSAGADDGDVLWRLGGKRNQFTFAPAGEPGPSGQHDARRSAPGVISLFDNGIPARTQSRAIEYQVNETSHTATRIRDQRHAPPIFAFAQGNFRHESNGDLLVGWGITGTVTEYDSTGTTKKLELNIPGGVYRTVRDTWTGRPDSKPAVVVEPHGANDTVFVSWNGETDIASWEVLTGATRSSVQAVKTVPRDGFETSISVPDAPFVQVRARSAGGAVLGTSAPVPVGPWFSEAPTTSANGAYRLFTGDFTSGPGDDVVFYAPGPGRDYLWTSGGAGSFTDQPLPPVNGDYHPLVGDFVGDAHDDILWTKRGSTRAYLWRSEGASQFSDTAITVPAASIARVLPHRLGPDEVLWYNPGSGADRITGYRWNGAGSPTVVQRSIAVNGSYRPVIGDFDGNGWADIVWYAAGPAADQYWRLTGNPGGASFGQRATTTKISGTYTPVVGRFTAGGDGRDDIVWYAPGAGIDYVWEGTTTASFTESAHPTTFAGTPLLLHGAQDQLYIHHIGADGTIWVPNGGPDIVRPAGNSAFAAGYKLVTGDFENTGVSGILWQATGPAAERVFRPRLG